MQAVLVMRQQLAAGMALAGRDGAQHAHIAACGGQVDQPGLADRLDESLRAAIHDRHFGTVDLDQCVVHTQAIKCGHDVLDR